MLPSKSITSVLPFEKIELNIEKDLKDSGQWSEVLCRFGSCQNDYDRLNVVLSIEEVLRHVTPPPVVKQKSLDLAESLRNAGNEHFKTAQYGKALSYYSKAVRYAPHPSPDNNSSKVLALCFGNRSAAFFHLKQFHSCLTDIDNALQVGFPASSMYKLLDRKGKCLLFLKRKRAAIEAFEDAKRALMADANVQDKAKKDMIQLTDQFLIKCNGLPDEDENSREGSGTDTLLHEPVPTLSQTSAQILCASSCVTMKSETGRGRGLFATRDIKIGEVLIVEKPYTSVVLTDHGLSHCHHCCARCFVPLPCEGCVDVVFCSAQCRQSAQQEYHTAECGLVDLFHQADVRLGHLAFKMVAKAGFSYCKEQRLALEHPKTDNAFLLGCDEKGVYDSENYATMYHLVGHGDQRSVEDVWTRAVKAAFLVKCLEQTAFFPPLNSNAEAAEEKHLEDMCYIGSHVLRHLMMLPCNAHEVSEMGVNWQDPSLSQTLEIGSAIYPVLSLINHSCDPSVVRHSYADVCVVRAIRSIAAGEELCDNYGALYPVMDKASRQDHLQKQYFFTCTCHACTLNWPMYMDIPKESIHFRCGKCRGRVPVPSRNQASVRDKMLCLDCGRRQNINSLILQVGSLEQGFQDSLHKVIFSLDVGGETMPRLVQFLRLVDKHMHRPVSCHNDCQEALKMCYAYKANAFPRKGNA